MNEQEVACGHLLSFCADWTWSRKISGLFAKFEIRRLLCIRNQQVMY